MKQFVKVDKGGDLDDSYLLIKEGSDCIPGRSWMKNVDVKNCSKRCASDSYFVHTNGLDCKCIKSIGCRQIANSRTSGINLYKIVSENRGTLIFIFA